MPADLPRSLRTGRGSRSWRTISYERRLLVVVHNVTAATRLFDVLPLVTEDHRVQTYYTCPGSSAFTAGTVELLAARGLPTIPWRTAIRSRFDLAIAASHGGDLHKLHAPLIILPHGMGYNKTLKPETGNRKPETGNRKPETGNRKPVFGLSEEWLMHKGKLIPSVLVLSHDEQLRRLAKSCPPALPAALVAGDPCFDRIQHSRPLRASYRDGFGLIDGQRLVVISSTWGPKSLYGQRPELPVQLAAQLPLDEYRIALVLHPNIWHGHSPGQLTSWLAGCQRAGITVLPPEEGWRAALIAADLVVGDYGSVSFYGVAQGAPLLLAAHPVEIVDAESPIAALLTTAPRLDPKRGLRDQVEDVIDDYDADRYRPIVELTTSAPGRSAELLRAAIYRELRLREPQAPPATSTVPIPVVEAAPISAQLVAVAFPDNPDTATVRRFPAETLYRTTHVDRGSYLVVGTNQPRHLWLERADVLLRDTPSTGTGWLSASLAALPGALVAAEPDRAGRWLVGDRDGLLVRFSATAEEPTTPDGALGAGCAAVLCGWLAAGLRRPDLPKRLTILRGGVRTTVNVVVLAPTGRVDDAAAPPVR